jgi:exodeoxyribonuclease III
MSAMQLQAQDTDTFKVISYNILEGMKTDTTKGRQLFVQWIMNKQPDLVALQECNGFTQRTLEQLAASYGHPYAVIVKENGYPVGLTSKYPILDIRKVNENMTHGFITAQVHGYNICVLHLNPHLYRKRRAEIAVILQTLALQPNQKNWLIMGDFNSHTPLDSIKHKTGEIQAYQKKAMALHPQIHMENLVDSEYIDYTVQQQVLNAGFTDGAWQYNSMAPKDKAGVITNSRIDYIYLSKHLRKKIRYCAFIYDDFTKKYSDHRPVYLILKK